jgi:hypothetical protein
MRRCGARTAASGVRVVHEGFDTLDLKEAKALLNSLDAQRVCLADTMERREYSH